MGIVGVSMEAARQGWAERLSAHEATLAAGYATLELNGFPSWLSALAEAWPKEVGAVLVGEIADELSRPDLADPEILSRVAAFAERKIAVLVAPTLLYRAVELADAQKVRPDS